jgi:diaminohydroxyphosphoribosylaminopyrimidine deaminase / 5-amino-6-(5-phosphoribosylamino)uracil reductase
MRAGRPRPSDARFMRRALSLAARGLGRTWPNPAVGAVLVRGGRVVGEGFHTRAGAPHAEIEALRAAGARARGADLFVTLEPCTHHGRTPPCVEALLGLGLARVVVAVADPNPRVRGRGIRALRRHGIPLTVGVGAEEAGELLAGFRSRVLRGRPLVTLKLAVTLDGRIAARGGDARWITGAAARREAHALRGVSDAVLVGAGTVRADDPRLTCRIPGGHDPFRIVLVGRTLDLPRRAQVLAPGGPPTLVVAPTGAPTRRVDALRRAGIDVLLLPGPRGRVRFAALARALGERGLTSLLVEGGAGVAAEALGAGVVDRVVLFVAPVLLGGDGIPAIGGLGVGRVADALRLAPIRVRQVGDDLMVEGRPRWRRRHPLPPGRSRATVSK